MNITERGQDEIGQKAESIGRACGSCSLCCKLLNVNSDEIVKPAEVWCKHCEVGKGCRIYDSRFDVCRQWACRWLIDHSIGDHWFPVKSKMVLALTRKETSSELEIFVDAAVPNRWREEPWFTDLRQFSLIGLTAKKGFVFQTYVVIRGIRRWLVLPNKVAAYDGAGVISLVGPGQWEWIPSKSASETHRTFGYRQNVGIDAPPDAKTALAPPNKIAD